MDILSEMEPGKPSEQKEYMVVKEYFLQSIYDNVFLYAFGTYKGKDIIAFDESLFADWDGNDIIDPEFYKQLPTDADKCPNAQIVDRSASYYSVLSVERTKKAAKAACLPSQKHLGIPPRQRRCISDFTVKKSKQSDDPAM